MVRVHPHPPQLLIIYRDIIGMGRQLLLIPNFYLMNYIHKNIISSLVITAVSLGAPFAAFAENAAVSARADASVKTRGNFCTMIQGPDFAAMAKFEDRMEKRDDHQAGQDKKTLDLRMKLDAKRGEKMVDLGKKVEDRVAKMSDKEMTDAQKAALLEAQAKVQAAIDTKNGDFAKLVAEYRADMDQVRTEHRTEIDALMAQMKIDIEAAITKAKADCAAGVAQETARATFQASMKSIHEKFNAKREAIRVETKADVNATVDARKDDRKEISATFRTSVRSAWDSFRALFTKKN